MTPYTLALGYFLTAIVFFGLDMIWLGYLAKDLYRKYLGHVLSPQVNWAAAGIFYLLFIAGIFLFVILPALEKGSLMRACIMGCLFGLVTYATYDLTNLATMAQWPVKIVVIDILWGMFLVGTVSAAGYKILLALGYSS